MYGDDDTHITGQITFSQIAEAIRHKKYGRDMREAIAQGFEQFIGILQRVSHLESEYSDLQSKYSDLLSKYNDIIDRLNDDENKIGELNQRCNEIKEKHNDDIKAVQEQLDRLNQAVFGYGEYEVNYETPPKTIDHVFEINTDSNPKLKGE